MTDLWIYGSYIHIESHDSFTALKSVGSKAIGPQREFCHCNSLLLSFPTQRPPPANLTRGWSIWDNSAESRSPGRLTWKKLGFWRKFAAGNLRPVDQKMEVESDLSVHAPSDGWCCIFIFNIIIITSNNNNNNTTLHYTRCDVSHRSRITTSPRSGPKTRHPGVLAHLLVSTLRPRRRFPKRHHNWWLVRFCRATHMPWFYKYVCIYTCYIYILQIYRYIE